MKPLLLLTLLMLTACTSSKHEHQEQTQKVNLLLEEISSLKNEQTGRLTHIVYFDLKDEINEELFFNEIEKLSGIKEVKDFNYGLFKDLKDTRALSQYDAVMEMSFENLETYEVYKFHPTHLSVREQLKSMLAAPPATYDFMKEKR